MEEDRGSPTGSINLGYVANFAYNYSVNVLQQPLRGSHTAEDALNTL